MNKESDDDRGKQQAGSDEVSEQEEERWCCLFSSHINTPHGSIPVASERSLSPI